MLADARALALGAVALGGAAAGPRRAMRFEARRVGRAARSGGRRCRTARRRRRRRERSPRPRRGSCTTRATPPPAIWPSGWSAWPRVEPRRHRVSRRAPSGPSAAHLPARHRAERRGSGSGAAAGRRRGLRDARRQAAARPVPGTAGPDGRRALARSRDDRPAGRDPAARDRAARAVRRHRGMGRGSRDRRRRPR